MKQATDTRSAPVYSVSQLNRLARLLLEEHFPAVLVEGEISSFTRPASGHWYLTLKDQGSQIRCAMFRNRNMFVRCKPTEGMRVLVKGRLSLYEGRGDYQLILEQLEETGAGALRRAFEQLQAKLQAEGLFSAEHKRPPPVPPGHLAVITSATGAAIHDVLSVLRRRFPALPVTIVPVAVQGAQSAPEIIAALDLVNRRRGCLADVDCILLTRGGGSLEDLWSFNDEALARAIFASELPVVAAVGHEVDFTIAEFVADLRAPTPSAAAELLSPHQDEYRQRLREQASRLAYLQRQKIAVSARELQKLQRRLQHPGRRLQEHAQRLDELELRLKRAIGNQLRHQRRGLQLLRGALLARSPSRQLALRRERLTGTTRRLRAALSSRLDALRSRLREQSHALNSISPLATLSRGYSITRDADGRVLNDYEQVRPGATIETRLARGSVTSVVESATPDPDGSD